MQEPTYSLDEFDEGRAPLDEALALLFPGPTALACLRADRLTPIEVRRAYDSRVKEMHPGWADHLEPSELAARERRFRELTAAYCQVIAHLREEGRFSLTVPTAGESPGASLAGPIATPGRAPVLIAVAGAREAVGASTVAAALAVALSTAGHPTLAADLDGTGLPLAHMLGGPAGRGSLDGLTGTPERAEGDQLGTLFPGLTAIGGATGAAEVRLLGRSTGRLLLARLRRAPQRFVVLDLGCADDLGHLDLFAAADVRIVVTTPLRDALLDAYEFLDKAVRRLLDRYRRARLAESSPERALFDALLDQVGPDGRQRTPRWLLTQLLLRDRGICRETSALIRSRPVDLVVNHHSAQRNTAGLVRLIAMLKNDLDVAVGDVHPVPEDKGLFAAVRRDAAALPQRFEGKAACALYRVAQRLFFPEAPDASGEILARLRRAGTLAARAGRGTHHPAHDPIRLAGPRGRAADAARSSVPFLQETGLTAP